MSILNGTYAHETLLPEPQPFGEPFDITGEIQLENALDADTLDTGKEKLLVSAGRGNLMIHRLGENGVPVLVSELGGLGDSRQISVSEGFAYVTARADGLYICDLRDPEKPALAGRIDTLELATGVCAADGFSPSRTSIWAASCGTSANRTRPGGSEASAAARRSQSGFIRISR